jgi:hypothetical protein
MRNDFLLLRFVVFFLRRRWIIRKLPLPCSLSLSSQPCDLLITTRHFVDIACERQKTLSLSRRHLFQGNSIKSEEDSDQLREMHLKVAQKQRNHYVFKFSRPKFV